MNFLYDSQRIYLMESDKLVAEITWVQDGDVYTINHTFVDDSLRGQGIASTLVRLAKEEIERRNGKVQATCLYARHWLEKNKLD